MTYGVAGKANASDRQGRKDDAPRKPIVGIVGMDRDCDSALGITPHVTCRRQIVNHLVECGLLPLILPPHSAEPQEWICLIDGLIIPGGGDIHPQLYGESDFHPDLDWIDLDRDHFELALTRAALERDIPVFGFCRGMQVINVALGGSLIQHLPDLPTVSCSHASFVAWEEPVHKVIITAHTLLSRCFPDDREIFVNSIHHQAVKRVGEGLTITAFSEDGVPEALESGKHRYCIGVQWHPELMADPRQKALFQAFARAVRDRVAEST